MLITKDGRVLNECQPVDERTMNYLKQFWKLPDQEDIERQRVNLHTTDKFWALKDHRME